MASHGNMIVLLFGHVEASLHTQRLMVCVCVSKSFVKELATGTGYS